MPPACSAGASDLQGESIDIVLKGIDTGSIPCCTDGENILKELYMKTKGVFGLAIIVAVIGILSISCVTASSIGGTIDGHGLFSGGGAKVAVTEGAQEIASYSNILGLVDTGYADYAAKVKEAEAAGKQVTSTTTWLLIMTKTTAYAK
jgi:hypothetical protein